MVERRFMSKFFTLDEIKFALAHHDKDCIFELNAPEKILARLSIKPRSKWMPFWSCTEEKIKELQDCFIQSEIFCPHEGVNRLAECNVDSLDWVKIN